MDPIVSLTTPEQKLTAHNTHKVDAHMITEQVGQKLRTIRKARKLSIRSLAEKSGLSINTLSLIENGKTSPSVSTLYQLARPLNVPITAFFESEHNARRIVYQRAGERLQIVFPQGHVEKLDEGMPRLGSEPFITKLEPNATSGETPIIYGGRELIYCLEGHITYTVNDEVFSLSPGDSLIFDAYIPHTWQNTAQTSSRALLILCPVDGSDEVNQHFLMP